MEEFWIGSVLLFGGLLGFSLGLGFIRVGFLSRQIWQDALYLIFAGVFLGYVLSVLVPHVFIGSWVSVLCFLAGLGFIAFLNIRVINHDVCCDRGQPTGEFGLLSLGAMAICSTNDGFFMGLSDPELFSSLTFGMLFHKLTVSFMVARIIYSCSLHRNSKLGIGIFYLAISPLAYFVLRHFEVTIGIILDLLLGFSAGVLSYVALAGTLPRVRSMMAQRPIMTTWLVVPFIISLFMGFMHLETHSHGSESIHHESEDSHDHWE